MASFLTGVLTVLITGALGIVHVEGSPLRLAAMVDIPDVGEGGCVEPGPDGQPRPCVKQSPAGSGGAGNPSVPVRAPAVRPPARLPCNQIPWENDQKRQCAQRVQAECTGKHEEGTEEFQQCVYRGLTGGGVEKQKEKPKKKEGKRPMGKQKKSGPKNRSTPPTTPSPRRSSATLEIPASTSPTTPSPRTRGGSESPPPPSPPSPAPVMEQQCTFPFPPDCRGQCAGLQSYPTYEFESCLTRCDDVYRAAAQEYDRCKNAKGER